MTGDGILISLMLRLRGLMAKKAKSSSTQRHSSPPSIMAALGRPYRKEGVVYRQGALADAVFYVQKRAGSRSRSSPNWARKVIALLGAGEFFGEGCLIGQPLRLATASAMAESEVMRVAWTPTIRCPP